MILKQGDSCRLKVKKDASTRSFFRVVTENGEEFKLRKFKFQENQAIYRYHNKQEDKPWKLCCYILILH